MSENTTAAAARWIINGLIHALTSSQSIDEMIKTFENVVSSISFPDELIPAKDCLPITDKLVRYFSFSKSALQVYVHKTDRFAILSNIIVKLHDIRIITILRRSHGFSFFVACICYSLGTACFGLQRYDECSDFLHWVEENLISNQTHCDRNCVGEVLLATRVQLYILKMAMDKQDEAVVYVRKTVEYKEMVMGAGSAELGLAYIEAYEACVKAMDCTEALPLCLKALEICTVLKGENSYEVAMLRVDLAVFYHMLGESEKAGEETLLWESVLKNTDISDELTKAQIKYATRLIHFGKCEEAIKVLQVVVSRDDTSARGLVLSFTNIAKAFCMLGKVDDAKESLKSAVDKTSEGNGIDDLIFLGGAFVEMTVLYEKLEEFETAINMLKRVFAVSEGCLKNLAESLDKFDHHQKLLVRASEGLFSLITLAGREEQEIEYMRDVVAILVKRLGRGHPEVGYRCAKLGAALSNSGQEEEAVMFMENARVTMDYALGPLHVDSLSTSRTLSEMYSKLGRHTEALRIQKKVREDEKGLEPSEKQFMEKAAELLITMKEIVAKSGTIASSQTQ